MRMPILKVAFYLIAFHVFISCNAKQVAEDSKGDNKQSLKNRQLYIRSIEGIDEEIDSLILNRGKVLLSYSDCYTCHKEDRKQIGPAFTDINKRYPRKKAFIKTLAQRIIQGGRGAWGQSVMSAHPTLKTEDAEAMVAYILSIPSAALDE